MANKINDFLKQVFTGGRKQGKQPGDKSTPASNTRKKMKRAAEAKAAAAKTPTASASPAKKVSAPKKVAPVPKARGDRPKAPVNTIKPMPADRPKGPQNRGKKRPVEVKQLTGKVSDLPSKKKGIFADTFAKTKYAPVFPKKK